MEYLVSLLLSTINHGNKPFLISNRKKVTDLTLGTNKVGNLANDPHASDEPSLWIIDIYAFKQVT